MISGRRKGDQVLFPKTLLFGNHVSRFIRASVATIMGSVPQNILNGAIQLPALSICMVEHGPSLGIIIVGSPK